IEDTKAELFSQVACCKQSAKRRLTASDVSRRAIVSKERSGLLTTSVLTKRIYGKFRLTNPIYVFRYLTFLST
ncbi:MAG TPA: hypothetical protein H9825_13820, partial [Candidatus Sphingobacterium stercorigallinarum]|nr:hypothetical protein [Candidatus Sphingobacterium stercorigallinarum]